ncbi:MAG: nickel-dependent lactate racemase [Spirochaetaceae bacterium]|nr:nickel-dependent lactate racemase [Spirochaetaceae bacterium]
MKIELGFGKQSKSLLIPVGNIGKIMHANEIEVKFSETELIENALNSPIGTPPIVSTFKKGERVVIVTSDVTRPLPSYKVLPGILRELNKAGIDDDDITIVFGLGIHRGQTAEEKERLVGSDIFKRINCIDSDPDDVVSLGVTSRGTPVDIFKPAVESDKLICLGNIEYHYFAGYSGGYKAVMPGISTFSAIQKNHSHMVEEGALAGNLDTNPVRSDIEEVADFIKIDFLFNVVLDEHKNIVGAFAGDPVKAHREGCKFLGRLYGCPIGTRADIVIVSAGGVPKDINLYQAQKALDNAKYAVKKGGIIILVAQCKEGLGGESFEKWMLEFERSELMIEEIQRNFILGGHKAAAIALILKNAEIYLVSDMDPSFVENIFMKPFKEPQQALDEALGKKGDNSIIHIMPFGGSILPQYTGNN